MNNSKLLKHITLIAGVALTIVSCNENPKSKKAVSEETVDYAKNDSINEANKTKYKDGRLSEVRTLRYFNFYKDTVNKISKDNIKLILVVVEWNKFEALVSDSIAAFGQNEMNTMNGGSVEENKLIEKDAKIFFKLGESIFKTKINVLDKPDLIPNRDSNYVSFDFVTNNGFYTVQERKLNLENNQSFLSQLFENAKKIRRQVENNANRN